MTRPAPSGNRSGGAALPRRVELLAGRVGDADVVHVDGVARARLRAVADRDVLRDELGRGRSVDGVDFGSLQGHGHSSESSAMMGALTLPERPPPGRQGFRDRRPTAADLRDRLRARPTALEGPLGHARRRVHEPARRQHRRGGAAVDPAGPRHQPVGGAVGGLGLRADVRAGARPRRAAGRRDRAAHDVPRRARRLRAVQRGGGGGAERPACSSRPGWRRGSRRARSRRRTRR